MKKMKVSGILNNCCNVCLLVLAAAAITYSAFSLLISTKEAKSVYNLVEQDYEACFGKNYLPEGTYFTNITCMKMEIVTDIINKSSELKKQYKDSKSNDKLIVSLNAMQEYNKPILYRKHPLPLLSYGNSLYSSLNYMTYAANALLVDIHNFITDPDALSLAADKDNQQIHIMAALSSDLALNVNKQIYYCLFILLAGFLTLLGTSINIYRLKKRKHKYKIKVTKPSKK